MTEASQIRDVLAVVIARELEVSAQLNAQQESLLTNAVGRVDFCVVVFLNLFILAFQDAVHSLFTWAPLDVILWAPLFTALLRLVARNDQVHFVFIYRSLSHSLPLPSSPSSPFVPSRV